MLITLSYIQVDKKRAQSTIKYLSTAFPLDRCPISEEQLKVILEHSDLCLDPSDYRYGVYRLPQEKLTALDLTHVKRIRPSKDNDSKLEVIVTAKSNESANFKGLAEAVGEELVFGEVQVPH